MTLRIVRDDEDLPDPREDWHLPTHKVDDGPDTSRMATFIARQGAGDMRFRVLSLLDGVPDMTGFELQDVFNRCWPRADGDKWGLHMIEPSLTALKKAGWVHKTGIVRLHPKRQTKFNAWAITPGGKANYHRLLEAF